MLNGMRDFKVRSIKSTEYTRILFSPLDDLWHGGIRRVSCLGISSSLLLTIYNVFYYYSYMTDTFQSGQVEIPSQNQIQDFSEKQNLSEPLNCE